MEVYPKQRQKPILLDGAMGTQLMLAGMPPGVCTEEWACDHPEVVENILRSYIRAGSDMIYAPTFLGNRPCLERHGLADRLEELNTALVLIAKKAAANTDTKVAGGLSSTGLMLVPYGDTPLLELVSVYAEQAFALKFAGADCIVIETMSSVNECRAAILGARQTGLPVYLTISVNENGVTMFGADAVAALVTLQGLDLSGFGLNCSEGPAGMKETIARLLPYAKVPLIAKPNAGDNESPQTFAQHIQALLTEGVVLTGGCCGTTPGHIAALREVVDSFDPAVVSFTPADYEILLSTSTRLFHLSDDMLEFSEEIQCELDMSDTLIDAADSSCDAVLIRIDTADDVYHFSMNIHMLDGACALISDNEELLEQALLHYCGRAIISSQCEIERDILEMLANGYNSIVV